MPFSPLSAPPTFISPEEHANLQQSTPTSFAALPPVLRLTVQQVRCRIEPDLGAQFAGAEQAANGSGAGLQSWEKEAGTLWLTEGALSFLTPSGKGFSIDYPSISLHAVSRSLPPSLEEATPAANGASNGASESERCCLYCQLDEMTDGNEEQEDDEENGGSLREMWILPDDGASLEPIFETLSYCASLHPSNGPNNNPFGGFGDDDDGWEGEDGAFDDAAEPGEGDEQELSEAGRAALAHLESIIQWPAGMEPTSTVESFEYSAPAPLDAPRAAPPVEESSSPAPTVEPTNALIFTNLPDAFFDDPTLANSLPSLLNAYGPLHSWSPLPSFGRALATFAKMEDAALAKEKLDRLLLPLEGDGAEDQRVSDSAADETVKKADKSERQNGAIMRVFFGPWTPLVAVDVDTSLPVPVTDKNFLISPPGSPPVGWEPIREDPPNADTLADDLMRALGDLRDHQQHLPSHEAAPLTSDAQISDDSRSSGLPPPSLIISPSQVPPHPGHPAHDTRSIPGVTVQSFDPEGAQDGAATGARTGLSISGVKATVESMRGPSVLNSTSVSVGQPLVPAAQSDEVPLPDAALPQPATPAFGLVPDPTLPSLGAGKRITPTGRPPLAG